MGIRGSRLWSRQPPNGFIEINPALPNPFAIFRTLADRQQIFPGPVNSSSTWTGVGSRTFAGEAGLYTSGGGVMHTLAAQPDRRVYAMALRFQQLTTGATQSIFGINGADNGTQVRINTSEQLELLSEASALLATSSTAPFGNTTTVHTLVVVCPTTSGPTTFYLNGKQVMSYAGAVDNNLLSKYLTFGRRGGSGETLTGVIFDAVYWSGPSNVPSLGQAQEISRDYYGTVYAPRRVGIYIGSTGGPATYNVSLTETGSATDALTVIASYVLAVSESAAATDAASAVATWPRSVSESTTASDIVAAVQTLGAAVSETVTAADLVSAILAAAAAISDAASAADAVTSSLNGTIYPVSVDESAASTDTVAAVAQMVAQIAESASTGDAYAVAANLVAVLTETGSPADVVSVPGGYSVSLTEAATALDVVAAAVAGVITPSAAPFGHGADAGRRLGALLGRRAGTFARTR